MHDLLASRTFAADSLDADEVKVVNRLMPRGIVTLLSKPVKTEWLEELFSRYGEKRG